MSNKEKTPYHCFPFDTEDDGRQFSPSAQRNRPHILKVLQEHLPKEGTVLEVAAGTGEHAVYFAPALPHLKWLATDPAEDKLVSIKTWMNVKPSENLLEPLILDAAAEKWPVEDMEITPPIAAIVCVNMIHVSPWQAGLGLLAAAGRILPKGGILYLYGAYMVDGKHTAPSNVEFDKMLKRTDPAWGVRDLRDVKKEAGKNGLKLRDVIDMPANNLSVIFEKG